MHLVKAVMLLVVAIAGCTYAQKCMSHPCGKLKCDDVTSCNISYQSDCAEGEEYLYPGLICECCGACVNRSLGKQQACATVIKNSHVCGCEAGLCCSSEGKCEEKTSNFGA